VDITENHLTYSPLIRAALLPVACFIASAQPSDVPAQTTDAKGRVYVYRYEAFQGEVLRPSIYVDEQDVARIQNGRGVILALEPGQHTLRSNDKQSQITLDVKAGRAYYIRLDLNGGAWKGVGKGLGRLTQMLPEQGVGEFKEAKPAEKRMIKDASFLAPEFVAD
jgi:hypothetical protein